MANEPISKWTVNLLFGLFAVLISEWRNGQINRANEESLSPTFMKKTVLKLIFYFSLQQYHFLRSKTLKQKVMFNFQETNKVAFFFSFFTKNAHACKMAILRRPWLSNPFLKIDGCDHHFWNNFLPLFTMNHITVWTYASLG